MHPLISEAKAEIDTWHSGEPSELAFAAALLCGRVLDEGGLPNDSPDWRTLRKAFDVQKGQGIARTLVTWDDHCTQADVDIDTNFDAYVKLGIVTWIVKFVLKWFGMLSGSERIDDFGEWKRRLQKCLDDYIVFPREPN